MTRFSQLLVQASVVVGVVAAAALPAQSQGFFDKGKQMFDSVTKSVPEGTMGVGDR